jgi:hypothetical protein
MPNLTTTEEETVREKSITSSDRLITTTTTTTTTRFSIEKTTTTTTKTTTTTETLSERPVPLEQEDAEDEEEPTNDEKVCFSEGSEYCKSLQYLNEINDMSASNDEHTSRNFAFFGVFDGHGGKEVQRSIRLSNELIGNVRLLILRERVCTGTLQDKLPLRQMLRVQFFKVLLQLRRNTSSVDDPLSF